MSHHNQTFFDFNPTTGALTSLRKGSREFLLPHQNQPLFTLRFRNATGRPIRVDSGRAASVSHDTTSGNNDTIYTLTFREGGEVITTSRVGASGVSFSGKVAAREKADSRVGEVIVKSDLSLILGVK